MNQHFTIFFLLFFSISSSGQHMISGIIKGDMNDKPLYEAVITDINTNNKALSKADGSFKIEVDKIPATLEITAEDYSPKIVTVENPDDKINVTLQFDLSIVSSGPSIIPIVQDVRLKHSANYNDIKLSDIKTEGSTSIIPALDIAPGIHIQSGALNTNRITIRGIGNRSQFTTAKIRAYLNEIPLTNGVGETSLEDLDQDFLASAKIVKGPNVSNYGSGLGGSIILNTDDTDTLNSISTKFETGSYGLLRSSNRLGYSIKEKNSGFIHYSFTHNDGYRENNEYYRHNLFFGNNFEYKKGKIFFLMNHTDLKSFIPSSLNEEDYNNEPTKAAFNWNSVKGFEDYHKTQIGITHSIGWNKWVNHSTLFGSFFNSYESRPFNILDDHSNTWGARTKFNYYFPLGKGSGFLKFGAEYFNEKYAWKTFRTDDGIQGDNISDNKENRQYMNLFAEADWEFIPNLTIETGLNFNSTGYDYEDLFFGDTIDNSGNFRYDPIISPRLGINYFWSEKLISFYGNISHGFNAPTLEETLTPDGAKNPEIRPEIGWNYEVGSRGNIKKILNYDISIYHMQVKDLLVSKRIAEDQFQGINAGRTTHSGLELDLSSTIFFLEKNKLIPFFNYHFAHYKFSEFIDGDNDYSGNELTGAIPHKVNAGLRYESSLGLYGTLRYQFVDGMPMRDDNSIYSDSYQIMNLKLGYQKTFGQHWMFGVYGGINNLWNEKYASQILVNAGSFGGNAPRYYYPGLPRNYYTGIKLTFMGWGKKTGN